MNARWRQKEDAMTSANEVSTIHELTLDEMKMVAGGLPPGIIVALQNGLAFVPPTPIVPPTPVTPATPVLDALFGVRGGGGT
jgi:hypothetical protein